MAGGGGWRERSGHGMVYRESNVSVWPGIWDSAVSVAGHAGYTENAGV
jgi:hypothetical protein